MFTYSSEPLFHNTCKVQVYPLGKHLFMNKNMSLTEASFFTPYAKSSVTHLASVRIGFLILCSRQLATSLSFLLLSLAYKNRRVFHKDKWADS